MAPSFLRADKLKAVFIDLDDTLLDETAHMRGAYGKSLDELRDRVSPDQAAATYREYEYVVSDLLRRDAWDELAREQRWEVALQRAGVEPGDLPVKICDGYYRHYFEGVGFLPGAERLLDVASHFENCLITNGEHGKQWGKIRKMDVDSRLNHILVSEDLGIRKPDPRIFERALELTGSQPSESVMIGDSLHADIAGAGPIGIGTIWINQYGYSLDEATHEPDEMVTTPGEAASLIEQVGP